MAPVGNTVEAALFWAREKKSSIVCVQLRARKPAKDIEAAKGARHLSKSECLIWYLNGEGVPQLSWRSNQKCQDMEKMC